jgi:uncharacterized protein
VWRLSIAEVDEDGPFSLFEGMARILTVIEGNGMVLESENSVLDAAYWKPTAFSGETKINSYLNDGSIRDFNVIYDPVRICAKVKLVTQPFNIGGKQNLDCVYALYCIAGSLNVDNAEIDKGSIALCETLPEQVQYSQNSAALLVSLATRSGR